MYPFFMRVVFLCGISLGILLAIITLPSKNKLFNSKKTNVEHNVDISPKYNRWFHAKNVKRCKVSMDFLRYTNRSLKLESEYLYDKVKVHCIILVRKTRNANSAAATWANHCNHVSFVNLTTKTHPTKLQLPIKNVRINSSWPILCNTLRGSSLKHNWTLIVNDDTFALVENLRYMVAHLNDSIHYYLGHPITFWNTVYNVAQAGYALSKGTVRAIQDKFQTGESCATSGRFWNQEDYYIGKHLESLNISPTDTRDENGLSTFHGFNLGQLLFPGSLKEFSNYYKYSVYPTRCCSPHSITFQAIDGDKMHTYHYLLYQLQIFKTGSLGNRQPKIPNEEVWKSFLHSQGIFKDFVSPEEYYNIWEKLVHDPTVFNQQLRQHESSKNDNENK